MLDVFLQLLPREHEVDLDASLLAACQDGYPECVRLLLKREDPSKTSTYTDKAPSERITINGALYLAITHFRPENVRVLLDDPRTTFKFTETFPPVRILEVIPKHRYDIFAMIISDPRLTPENIVPYLTGYFSDPPLVRLLLTRQDLDLNDSELHGYIRETLTPTTSRSGDEIKETSQAYNKDISESIRIVFSDPRFDPNLFLQATFEFPTFISSPALRDLLMDPHVEINALPDSLLISLIYLNGPEVLRAFLERPDISRTTLLKLYQSATLPLYPGAEPRNAAVAVNLIRPHLTNQELWSSAIIDYNAETVEILGFVIETYFP
jgi:hypothetical protein